MTGRAEAWNELKRLANMYNIPQRVGPYSKAKKADILNDINRITRIYNDRGNYTDIQRIKPIRVNTPAKIRYPLEDIGSFEDVEYKNIIYNTPVYTRDKYTSKLLDKKTDNKNNINDIINFMNNPEHGKYQEVKTYINDALKLVKTNNKYNLLLRLGSFLIPIKDTSDIRNMTDKIESVIFDKEINEYDNMIKDINEFDSVGFEWREKEGLNQPGGAYFPYYHNMAIDLSRYGIYRDDNEANMHTNNHIKNCLEIALEAAKVDAEDIKKINTSMLTRYIPKKHIEDIANKLNRCIILTQLRDNEKIRPLTYNEKDKHKGIIRLGLINGHYFHIDKVIMLTSYAIDNYDKVKTFKDWNIITKFKGHIPNRDKSKIIDSYHIIKNLIRHKEKILTLITLENCGKFDTQMSLALDYPDTVPSLRFGEFRPIEYKQKETISAFEDHINDKEPKKYNVYYIDTETTTDGIKHTPFHIEFKTRDLKKGAFSGFYCILNFLNSITENYIIIIAHNMRYDVQPFIPYLYACDNLIKTGAMFKSLNAKFYNIKEKRSIKILFKDSYAFISAPIKLFPKMFRTPVKKEIYPFKAYTTHTVKKAFISLAFFLSHIEKPSEKIEAIENLIEWGHFVYISPDYLNYIKECIEQYYKYKNDIQPSDSFDNDEDNETEISRITIPDNDEEHENKIIVIYKFIEEHPQFYDVNILHMKYMAKYCSTDVELLYIGYERTRQDYLTQTEDKETNRKIDIDYYISSSEVAKDFATLRGCFNGVYDISGYPRAFIQRCIEGGRCMTAENKRYKINHPIDCADKNSLYPFSMCKIDTDLGGFIKGIPKVWNKDIDISKVAAAFLLIHIDKVNKSYKIPLISRKNKEGIRVYNNNPGYLYTTKIGLEDLIRFHKIEYKIITGYYYDSGRTPGIANFINELYNKRLQMKKDKNPAENCLKTVMNCIYGRTIMKPIDKEYKIIKDMTPKKAEITEDAPEPSNTKTRGNEINKFLTYHNNNITEMTEVNKKITIFTVKKNITEHFSAPHIGSEILAMSKRIMMETTALADDNDIPIYYTDTDSIYIDAREIYNGKAGLYHLADLYRDKYSKELIGNKLGEMHSDLKPESEDSTRPTIAINSIFGAKKFYCCKLIHYTKNKTGFNRVITYNSKAKGIPTKCIENLAKKEFYNNPYNIYKHLYDDKSAIFDLTDVKPITMTKNLTAINTINFKRVGKF